MENVTTIGIDLAKAVVQVHGVNRHGKAVLKKRLKRTELLAYLSKMPRGVVVMEACGGAHWWASQINKLGHDAKLIAPQHVKPFVKSNKNDYHDAEAICEAAQRPSMRFVAVKDEHQLVVQSLHRVREQVKAARVALINQLQGLLLEFGYALPKGRAFKSSLESMLSSDNALPESMRMIVRELQEQLSHTEKRLKHYDAKIAQHVKEDARCQTLMQLDGVGEITASAVVASLGNGAQYKNGRSCAAGLGLVPRQHSSGQRHVLLGISKRGDSYLRQLLIHGARAVIRHIAKRTDRLAMWLKDVMARRGKNRAAVALANKNARWIWHLLQGHTVIPVTA